MVSFSLNVDFTQPVIIETETIDWQCSPAEGIRRRALEREHEESGLATTIVSFDAGASFAQHTHTGGEEFFVLEGTFSDEHGDFHRGSYLRNPPGTQHKPFSQSGCVIFVKLCHMRSVNEIATYVDTSSARWEQTDNEGQAVQHLYETRDESVQLVALQVNTSLRVQRQDRGLEILIIEGQLSVNGKQYPALTWMRFPPGMPIAIDSHTACKYWCKHWSWLAR